MKGKKYEILMYNCIVEKIWWFKQSCCAFHHELLTSIVSFFTLKATKTACIYITSPAEALACRNSSVLIFFNIIKAKLLYNVHKSISKAVLYISLFSKLERFIGAWCIHTSCCSRRLTFYFTYFLQVRLQNKNFIRCPIIGIYAVWISRFKHFNL